MFALNMRRLRLRRFATIDEYVAALSANGVEKVSRQTVSHWERGYRTPSVQHFPVIADTLGVHIHLLMPDPDAFNEQAVQAEIDRLHSAP